MVVNKYSFSILSLAVCRRDHASLSIDEDAPMKVVELSLSESQPFDRYAGTEAVVTSSGS